MRKHRAPHRTRGQSPGKAALFIIAMIIAIAVGAIGHSHFHNGAQGHSWRVVTTSGRGVGKDFSEEAIPEQMTEGIWNLHNERPGCRKVYGALVVSARRQDRGRRAQE